MITGYVIGESLRPGADFGPPGLRLRKVGRVDVSGSVTRAQPTWWTFVEWEADDEAATEVAEALAAALEPEHGWYADFAAGDDRVVVFAGKVFRYRRGDETGRAEAVAYGRSAGTPEHQLDWQE
jgi:ketosteroid isomerase-like protein